MGDTQQTFKRCPLLGLLLSGSHLKSGNDAFFSSRGACHRSRRPRWSNRRRFKVNFKKKQSIHKDDLAEKESRGSRVDKTSITGSQHFNITIC